MTPINYLAFAIPGFFIFLFIEYRIAQAMKKRLFKFESSVTSLSIGIAERLLNLFISASFYDLFKYVYEQYALFEIPSTWYVWVGLLLATDLVWYWYHRFGHEINIFWAAHIVHHQSEEFNLTVSARITTLQALIRGVFWCALPFVGFKPQMVIAVLVAHGAYSFFTHTQLVGKLGWIEHVFVTPSIHGVHHASDEKYLDKNYGDVFVFWDKIFGTYMREQEKPTYGLTHPLQSHSFLWQHFHYYFEIYEACRRADSFGNKMKIVFGSPAVLDQDIRPSLEKRFIPNRREHWHCRFRFRNYLYAQLALCVAILTGLTAYFAFADAATVAFCLAFILISLVNCGALLEQRRWIYYLEYVRLTISIAYASYLLDSGLLFVTSTAVVFLLQYALKLDKVYERCVLRYDEVKA